MKPVLERCESTLRYRGFTMESNKLCESVTGLSQGSRCFSSTLKQELNHHRTLRTDSDSFPGISVTMQMLHHRFSLATSGLMIAMTFFRIQNFIFVSSIIKYRPLRYRLADHRGYVRNRNTSQALQPPRPQLG